MQFLSQVTLSQLGGGAGSSMWGWVDPLTRKEYAIMGRSTGTSFIDVTDPTQPRIVATMGIAAGSTATSWREPKIIGNHAFVGVDGTTHGVQVLDLTRLRSYSGTTLNLTADTVFNGLTRQHTLAINSMGGVAQTSPDGRRYIYAAGSNLSSGGIRAIDVTNPLAPTSAGGFSADGYTHEMQVVTYTGPDQTYAGREIAFAHNVDTVTIVDVTNKSAMTQLGRTVQPQRGYVHQGWLTPDQRYMIANDELDERNNLTGGLTSTHFWDVSDLDNPVYKGRYLHATTSVDHNLYIKGDYIFMANYTTGLRVFKIGDLNSSNPNDWMYPVAFFDTYAANDGNSFNGAWNNYPFFPSGNIAVSDINGGLIMLRMNLPTLGLEGTAPSAQYYQTQYAQVMAGYGISVPEPTGLAMILPAATLLRRRK
jgi:choice-of-anchor B domain-containing protein